MTPPRSRALALAATARVPAPAGIAVPGAHSLTPMLLRRSR
ncbi:hypothetical protein [Sphaerisporangium rhizosphaerae]|uniref:Uncharacterized protein n=1 Tax=Sphaerisporangium rhizosphaerae TaxID=2269375 RepID=A0ABW2P907_9ACTN